MNGEKFTLMQYSISAILGLIEAEDFVIPEIQRPFVWKRSQVRDLIDSLYNGYPTGYIITWKNPDVQTKDGGKANGKKVLIDGQQRKEKTMSKDLVTMTIEIDIEVYNKAAELFENLGTTIEDMTVGFLRFCVIPENLPLLKAYLGIENAPAEAGAQPDLHHRIFKQVFDIATKNTG